MKRSYKFTTKRQYQQIAVELEPEQKLTDEMMLDAIDEFEHAQAVIDGGAGLERKQFNDVVDCMMRGETVKGGLTLWEQMNPQQQFTLQEIKKSMKRINSKLPKND